MRINRASDCVMTHRADDALLFVAILENNQSRYRFNAKFLDDRRVTSAFPAYRSATASTIGAMARHGTIAPRNPPGRADWIHNDLRKITVV
jgi:hypothetical protein